MLSVVGLIVSGTSVDYYMHLFCCSILQKHQILEAGQVHVSAYGHSYFSPSTTGAKTSAWSTYRTANGSSENGFASNSGYHHDQRTEVSRDVQSGLTSTTNSALGAANGLQESCAYASYPTSAHSHGYENTSYASYPTYSYPSQTNPSYPQAQQMGSYPTSGAPPYRSHPSFQITSSYGPSTSYSSTHYNAADYQTTGGYQSSGYDNQTNMWYDYGNNYQYPNYQSDSVGAHNSSSVAVTQLQYQPQYQQWANNYSQNASDVSCAPGTENLSVTTASTLNCAVPGISGGYPCYPASSSQPPPPGTTSWRPDSSSSEIHSVQLQV